MRCGKCNGMMKKREGKILGKSIEVYFCDRCGNKLIPINEAIKLQVIA